MAETNLCLEMKNKKSVYLFDELDKTDCEMSKLKKIRPFSEAQLLSLHCNDSLNSNETFINEFVEKALNVYDNSNLYKLLKKFERRRIDLQKCKDKLIDLQNDCNKDEENVWKIENKILVKKGKCADNRTVHGSHKYKESIYNRSSFNSLEQNLLIIQKTILDDYCLLLYNMETVYIQSEYEIDYVLSLENCVNKQEKMENLISSLFAFHRVSNIYDKKFNILLKEWLTRAIVNYYKDISFSGRLFLLNHILRCPAGKINFFAKFFECPNPYYANSNKEAVEILNFSLVAISTILSTIKYREKFIKVEDDEMKKNSDECNTGDSLNDNIWHLVDTEIENGEDIKLDKFNLTESDILDLLAQISFNDLLKFITHGIENSIENDESGFIFGEYSELSILKLISVATQIVKILRNGLITFNCMRFKSLYDYITTIIKKTVKCVSNFWQQCKNHFYTQDQALIIRIQVEYDHFILRSVVTILNCQKYGVWKFISVIPFDGITESMIWHIVWVFYNGRDEIDELGGLCPYFSDSYWKSKFNEKSVKIQFKEKLPNLSSNELECLIKSLGNMIKSRKKEESEFVKTIAIDMFEIFFYEPLANDNLIELCTNIFSSLMPHQFFIIISILNNIDKTKKVNENCIKFFSKVDLKNWIPDDSIRELLNKWIFNEPITSSFNRLARIIFSRLNYGLNTDYKLIISNKLQQEIAIIIYNALDEHINNNKIFEYSCSFVDCNYENLLALSQSTSIKQFMEWAWRMFLILKLNTSSIEEESEILNLNDDKLFFLRRGFLNKNLYSIFLTLIMTDVGQNLNSFENNLDLICHLLMNKIYVPSFKILEYFIPLHIDNLEQILNNFKFNNLINQILNNKECNFSQCILAIIKNQLEKKKNSIDLLTFWINYFCNQTCLFIKQNSNSWFVNSSKGFEEIVYILDQIFLIVFNDAILLQKAIEVVSVKSSEIQNFKLPQSNLIYSWLNPNNETKKCEWTTPLHYLYEKFNFKIYFGYILIKADYLKIEKLWEDILFRMSNNTDQNIETIIKNVCSNYSVTNLPYNLIPINAWAKLSIDCEKNHPLMPLILFNFFTLFFANISSEGSMGLRSISKKLLKNVKVKIDKLLESENKKQYSIASNKKDKKFCLLQLYQAYSLWIEDGHLHDAFVDLNNLSSNYMVDLLKTVFTDNTDLINKFIDPEILQEKISNECQYWNRINYVVYSFENQVIEDDFNKQIEHIKSKTQCLPKLDINFKQKEFWFDLEVSDVLIEHLKSKIECLIAESKQFDNKLKILSSLNTDFLSNLTELHKNIPETITYLVTCNKINKGTEGCLGALSITFTYSKDYLDDSKNQLIKRNRMEYNFLLDKLMKTPSKRVIDCAICLKLCLHKFQNNQKDNSCIELLNFFLSLLKDTEIITFAPAVNIFNILIDTLNLSENFKDETTYYMIESAIKYPKLTQYFATRLSPSNCSSENFLNMYKLIQENLFSTPSNILFVMLSKFDLNNWLNNSNTNKAEQILYLLKRALSNLGQAPPDDKQILLGLYRKHLQRILIHKFPFNLIPVFKMMLDGMFEFNFYPILWKDILLSFGLYLPSNQVLPVNLVTELKKYASIQPLFTSSDIYEILKLLHTRFNEILIQDAKINLITYFKVYFHSFLPIMATLSFIWINTNEYFLPNFDNIWFNCINLWDLWIYPKGNDICEITLDSLKYMWKIYVAIINYYILTFNQVKSKILSLLFESLALYCESIDENNKKIFEIILDEVLELEWSSFIPNKKNLELMLYSLLKYQNYFERIVSNLITTINWKCFFQELNAEDLNESITNFAYILINTKFDTNKLCLDDYPFHLIPTNKLEDLANSIKSKVELEKYLINQDDLNKFLLKLLEMACLVNLDQKNIIVHLFKMYPELENNYNERNRLINELQYRKLVYSIMICGIINNSIAQNSFIYKKHPSELKMFFADFLYVIKIFEKETLEIHRMEIFNTIIPIINLMPLEEARKINFKTLLKNASINKIYSLNLFLACSQTISKNLQDFSYVCENSIINLANSNGKIEEISQLLDCNNILPEDFMTVCLNSDLYLSMYLIYFKLKLDRSLAFLLNDLGHFFLKIKAEPNLEAKAFSVWFNLLIELEENLEKDNLKLISYALKFAKTLNLMTEESNISKIPFFTKNTKKNISPRSIFLCLAISSLLFTKLNKILNEDDPNFGIVNISLKNILSRLQAFKKNKNFIDSSMLIEKLMNLLESNTDVREHGIPILKSWLLAYFSDANYFELMLKEYN